MSVRVTTGVGVGVGWVGGTSDRGVKGSEREVIGVWGVCVCV